MNTGPSAALRYPELFRDLSRNWDLIQKNLGHKRFGLSAIPMGKQIPSTGTQWKS